MLRLGVGSIIGLVAWVVVVTALNLGLRHGWSDYALVEKEMAFTLPMMIARLSISAASSLASGAIAARVGKTIRAAVVAGVILLLLFLPVHYGLWQAFPIWYHLIFLISLPVLSWIGGRLPRAGPPSS